MVFYIYKIKNCNYIGSTNDIKNRTNSHKSCCYDKKLKGYNFLVYQYIREKKLNIQLEILGVYKKKCSNKIKRLVEQYYINKYDSVYNGFNMINAFTNNKKYHKDYWKKNKELNKKYYEKNKEKRKKRKKEYYEKNKEKINTKINCPLCNGLITKRELKRHQKTKKCRKNSI